MNIGTANGHVPANLIELCRLQREETARDRHGRDEVIAEPDRQSDEQSRRPVSRLADFANAVDSGAPLRETRQQKVQRIRGEIKAGIYDVESRLEAALDRMIDELPLTQLTARLQGRGI